MPQLDFNTTFPQVFWLVTTFTIVYTVLIHFFLPNFIKLNRSRKNIVLTNQNTVNVLKNSVVEKQLLIEGIIRKNFFKLKSILEKEFPSFLASEKTTNLEVFDSKIVNFLYHNTLYYDSIILKSVCLKPNFLNSKL